MHLNVHTLGAVDIAAHLEQPTLQRPGSSRGLPAGARIRTHNLGLPRVSSAMLYPLGHDCPAHDWITDKSAVFPIIEVSKNKRYPQFILYGWSFIETQMLIF